MTDYCAATLNGYAVCSLPVTVDFLLLGLTITAACRASCEAVKPLFFNLIAGIIPVYQLVRFKIVFRDSRIAPSRKKKLIEGMEHAAVVGRMFKERVFW
ncbi:MAG: hypothetical protein V1782_05830 [Pseudomonadota bacterium]